MATWLVGLLSPARNSSVINRKKKAKKHFITRNFCRISAETFENPPILKSIEKAQFQNWFSPLLEVYNYLLNG